MAQIDIKPYLYKELRHGGYMETCEMHHNLLIHADGIYPGKLIDERRPSESKTIKEYRKMIYECQTSGSFGKILNSIGKIRKSQDWSVLYPKDNPAKIAEEETLEKYMETKFLEFGSFANWFFSHGLKQYLVDPNAVICVAPISFLIENNEYYKPMPVIYNSPSVYELNDECAILKSDETVVYKYNDTEYDDGEVFYMYTKTEIFKVVQIKPSPMQDRYSISKISDNPLGYVPARKIKGVFKKIIKNYAIYESRLTQCLPHWNEAVREYSDLQAEVVQHIHSTLIIATSRNCGACSGTGKVFHNELNKEGHGSLVSCTKCKGVGNTPINPYEMIEVRAPGVGEPALPDPIARYLEKNTEIVKIQDERIDKHIYKGFAAINFEFLAAQLNQSGVAKEWDHAESNAFIYDIGEDVVSVHDWCYSVVCDWRYIRVVPSAEDRRKMLPMINVPEKYDIFPDSYYVDEIDKARKGGMNSFIINALELQYANKAFSTDKTLSDFVKSTTELDPLAGIADDQKLVRAQAGYIAKTDFIISNYIGDFIRQALEENEDFYSLELKEKKAIMVKFAKEKEKLTTVADKFKIDDTRGDNKEDNIND